MGKARLPGWRTDPEMTRRVVELTAAGYSTRAVAERFGRSTDWVHMQLADTKMSTASSSSAMQA